MKIRKFFFCLILLCRMVYPMTAQDIIGHRWASYLAPENTLAAVRLGYELGADAVEIDVHLTKDRQIVVNHDKDTKRTSGGKNLLINESEAAALRQLEVGSWKDVKFHGEKIPFLKEVLAIVPQDKKLIIEIKSSAEILPYLQQEIQNSGIHDQLIIISFDKEAIINAKQMIPQIPAYWLLHRFREYTMNEAIQMAKTHKLNGLDVNYRLVTPELMENMKQANLELYVYTVNDPKEAERLRTLKVEGITTDRPLWLREQLVQQ